ncbi:NAD-dependent epimerase/dehydratase family protein [Haladaptatus cibarius]|uniref:NAD-dependent epimerase/dehydratase family protein n=1 Tax=Haladaptatus cibarius TaxID=453847 RepID=UPI000678A7D9|nr:NAD(P)-dependent oxidoreductase [Haladaptatus cibarius]
MTTNVLLTGAFGRVGTAIIDHLADRDEYEFTYLNRSEREEYDTFVADVSNYEEMRPAFDDQDAVIHLAGYPETDGTWEQILQNNIIGMQNTLQAARDAEVPKFIFGSTNHVVGMYEAEFAPELYEPGFDLLVDQDSPRRPDSYYGTSKSFDEDLGRYYVENYDYPEQFYSLRICSVRHEEYDHPYGDAEHGADEGEWERGSPEYDLKVARMKAMWQSRRDLAQQVDCCLRDDDVEYDVFFGVSDNDRRWFSIEHGRDVIGYDPQDNGEEWDAPPEGN